MTAKIESFGSLEEMFAAMRERRKSADARIEAWQHDAKPGDCFVRLYNDGDGVLVIYGQILDVVAEEFPGGYDEENASDEDRWHYENIVARYATKGHPFRFVRAFSPVAPTGEVGDLHIATINAIISKEEFDNAREQGWPQHPRALVAVTGHNTPHARA